VAAAGRNQYVDTCRLRLAQGLAVAAANRSAGTWKKRAIDIDSYEANARRHAFSVVCGGVDPMKPTKPSVTKSSAKKDGGTAAKSVSRPPVKSQVELPVEVDRRGKPLPPRQRVGGIITPQ
jgi:hypothetical protein